MTIAALVLAAIGAALSFLALVLAGGVAERVARLEGRADELEDAAAERELRRLRG